MNEFDINLFNPYVIQCSYLTKWVCPPPGTIYEERVVKWYELELIEWGEGFVITDGQKLKATKGCIFFRKPGMVVQGISPYYCKMILFDGQYKQNNSSYNDANRLLWDDDIKHCSTDIENISLFSNIPPSVHIKRYSEFEKIFTKAYEAFISFNEVTPIHLKTCLLQILSMLSEEVSTPNYANSSSRSIRANYQKVMGVRDLIDNEIAWNMKLEELAEKADLSMNFFCRIFRDLIGEPPITYINKCKMAKARKLLIETDFSVKRIALECGFENETYFFTLFRKLNEMSPLQYRALNTLDIFNR